MYCIAYISQLVDIIIRPVSYSLDDVVFICTNSVDTDRILCEIGVYEWRR